MSRTVRPILGIIDHKNRFSVRTKLPIVAAILGFCLLLMGLAGHLLLKRPVQETASIALPADSSSASLMRIPSTVGGTDGFDVTLEGTGPWTVSLIRSVDAEAWVAGAREVVVSRNGSDLATTAQGSTSVSLDKATEDIFASSVLQKGQTRQHIIPVSNNQRYDVIVRAAEGTSLPSALSIQQDVQRPQPWGLPLAVVGGLMLLASLIWLFLARRREESQRAARALASERVLNSADSSAAHRTGGSTKAGLVSAVVLSLAVAGPSLPLEKATTSPSPSASGTTTDAAADATPTVSGPQLKRIVEAVQATAENADAAKKADLLKPRMTGGALTLRSSNYAVRAKNPSIAAPGSLEGEIVTSMVPYSDSFPRTIVAVVQKSPEDLPVALVLDQRSAREDYRLRDSMTMLPGAHFPKPSTDPTAREIPVEEKGTAMMSASQTLTSLASYLSNPDGKDKNTFESTSFQTELVNFRKDVTKNAEGTKTTFNQAVDSNETRSLPTADGGSMVFGYLRLLYTATPENKNDSVNLAGTPYAKLVGSQTVKGTVEVTYGQSVMVYVPKEGSGKKPIVTGVDQELLSARKK